MVNGKRKHGNSSHKGGGGGGGGSGNNPGNGNQGGGGNQGGPGRHGGNHGAGGVSGGGNHGSRQSNYKGHNYDPNYNQKKQKSRHPGGNQGNVLNAVFDHPNTNHRSGGGGGGGSNDFQSFMNFMMRHIPNLPDIDAALPDIVDASAPLRSIPCRSVDCSCPWHYMDQNVAWPVLSDDGDDVVMGGICQGHSACSGVHPDCAEVYIRKLERENATMRMQLLAFTVWTKYLDRKDGADKARISEVLHKLIYRGVSSYGA